MRFKATFDLANSERLPLGRRQGWGRLRVEHVRQRGSRSRWVTSLDCYARCNSERNSLASRDYWVTGSGWGAQV